MDIKTKYKAKKIKAVFFDIDDTLRVKDTGYIPKSINRVFTELKKKGILTGIATGRGMYGIVPELQTLKPDYFVTLNGAYVVDKNDKVFVDNPIPNNLVEEYVQWCQQQDIDYGFAGKDNAAISAAPDLVGNAIFPV